MNQDIKNDRAITRYLLGQSSHQEQAEIEEKYFTDPAFMQEVISAEDDLIDAYVGGELRSDERAQFEAQFMTDARRRERVEFARALIASLPKGASEAGLVRHSWKERLSALLQIRRLALPVAVAAMLIIVAALWLFIESTRRTGKLEQARDEKPKPEQQQQPDSQPSEERAQNESPDNTNHDEKTAPETTPEKPPVAKPAATVAFVLTPGLSRDVESLKKLAIPPGTKTLRFQLSFEAAGDYSNLNVSLRKIGGAEILRQANLKIQRTGASRSVIVVAPAGLFAPGDYVLTLTGVGLDKQRETLDDYPFTIRN